MNVIHSEFWPRLLENKGKTKLARSQNMCAALIDTQICEILLIS